MRLTDEQLEKLERLYKVSTISSRHATLYHDTLHNAAPSLIEELRELRKDKARLLNVARGCHDYGGGYGAPRDSEIYHHGIQTVINALEAAAGSDTLQVRVLEQIGRDAAMKESQ